MSTPILPKGSLVELSVHKALNSKCTKDIEIIHNMNQFRTAAAHGHLPYLGPPYSLHLVPLCSTERGHWYFPNTRCCPYLQPFARVSSSWNARSLRPACTLTLNPPGIPNALELSILQSFSTAHTIDVSIVTMGWTLLRAQPEPLLNVHFLAQNMFFKWGNRWANE